MKNKNDGASGIGVDLLSGETEARDLVRRFIASREWWIFPWVSDRAGSMCSAIEAAHYTGAANKDFVLMFGSGYGLGSRIMTIAFAHKRQMTPAQLTRFFPASIEALEAQDIICAMNSKDDQNAIDGAFAFYRWVEGEDGWSGKRGQAA